MDYKACNQVDPEVIQNFVGKCDEWMIWKHDVYGNNFQKLWLYCEIKEADEVEQ